MNAHTISTLTNAQLNEHLTTVGEGIRIAEMAYTADPAYVACMQPVYDALLAEWVRRYPAEHQGATCG